MRPIDIEHLFNSLVHEPNKNHAWSNARFHINSEPNLTHNDCIDYFNKWRIGFTDLSHEIIAKEANASFAYLSYRLRGTHNGIFYHSLPTGKKISGTGIVFIRQHKQTLDVQIMEDLHLVWSIIDRFSEKEYKEAELSGNDFAGPAGPIYRSILSSRTPPASTDQLLANTFRWMSHQIDTDCLPTIPYLEKMQRDVSVDYMTAPLKSGNVSIKWYKPNTIDFKNLPSVVYFHGGGWVMDCRNAYDLATKKLAWQSQMNVFSIEYRLAPEHPFPTYYMDCFQGFEWLRSHLLVLGIKNTHLAAAGDSAGGCMAGGLVHYCHDRGIPVPDAIMMLSPVTDLIFENYPSFFEKSTKNVFLSYGVAAFQRAVSIPIDKWREPHYSPVYGDLSYFPPTLVIIGGDDPLLVENQCFVDKLKKVSTKEVVVLIGDRMPHAYPIFIGMSTAGDLAYETMVNFLKNHLKHH